MDKLLRRHADAGAKRIDEDWGNLLWLAGEKVGNARGLTLGRVIIKTSHCNPRHAHANCEEVLYLIAGRIEHSVGDEKVVMEPGDTLTVAPGVFHNALSTGEEDADMIVAYSSAVREFELESK
ncbi:MAG: cupin domain-containing protein [Phycisphaerae bacterium]|jgi:mannose-6-phosphate isomerase-like protein (cupin superfamily)|nr:cupin domain-containing protein [Phycisphaerae bacterium]